jgi:predicted GNAT superfamily acetyltransferase
VAGSQTAIDLRQLFHLDDFQRVVDLQREIWGFAELELLPLRFLVVVSRVGGHVFGAFDGEKMIGFCFAIPGIKPGAMPYLHSHMLGVLPEYRNHAIGRRLKVMQREDALARGIKLIEWTFDPMELKNAFLNIEKLGAIIRRYHPNLYGSTSSPLHGGLPTDRVYAEWWLEAPPRTRPTNPAERIAYPVNIAEIRASDPARAREIQAENATRFQAAFSQGLAVTGFERTETEGVYLLEKWQ